MITNLAQGLYILWLQFNFGTGRWPVQSVPYTDLVGKSSVTEEE